MKGDGLHSVVPSVARARFLGKYYLLWRHLFFFCGIAAQPMALEAALSVVSAQWTAAPATLAASAAAVQASAPQAKPHGASRRQHLGSRQRERHMAHRPDWAQPDYLSLIT